MVLQVSLSHTHLFRGAFGQVSLAPASKNAESISRGSQSRHVYIVDDASSPDGGRVRPGPSRHILAEWVEAATRGGGGEGWGDVALGHKTLDTCFPEKKKVDNSRVGSRARSYWMECTPTSWVRYERRRAALQSLRRKGASEATPCLD